METRESRREIGYEAMLAAGRTRWRAGERVRVYRQAGGGGALVEEPEDGSVRDAGVASPGDPTDYDVEYYARLLRESFAARLARAFTPEDFETVFSDPMQPSLFAERIGEVRPILQTIG